MPVIESKREGPDQTAYHVSIWYLVLYRVQIQPLICAIPTPVNDHLDKCFDFEIIDVNPLCANRNKSRLLFSSAEMSTLFASLLNLSVMLGNYLQQTTSADDIFRCIIFLAL